MIELSNRITHDPDLCNGKPTIRGLRITVETVLDFLSNVSEKQEILEFYPDLEEKDIEACLKYAAFLMSQKYTFKSLAA